jgi:hypothetical protein
MVIATMIETPADASPRQAAAQAFDTLGNCYGLAFYRCFRAAAGHRVGMAQLWCGLGP